MRRARRDGPYATPAESFDSETVSKNSTKMASKSAPRSRVATPARSIRGTDAQPLETPGSRRSGRNAARQAAISRQTVQNPDLPEVQTQQSYAYGASKTPILPEQLQAKDLSMKAVADQIKTATNAAERRFEAQAADNKGYTPESEASSRVTRSYQRNSREPGPAELAKLATPDVERKTQRTAAWADSLEESRLDDIPEEESQEASSHALREDTEPSSFPSGIFDHSYNYERGFRAPQLHDPIVPFGRLRSVLTTASSSVASHFISWWGAIPVWLQRIGQTLKEALLDLPESDVLAFSFKTTMVLCGLAGVSFLVCALYGRVCEVDSLSIVSQGLQTICGRCTNPPEVNFNFTTGTMEDASRLSTVLRNIQASIHHLEIQLNNKISTTHSSLSTELDNLRKQQAMIEVDISRLNRNVDKSDSSGYVPSPLIPKVNWFSPSNGAIIDPYSTTPTHQKEPWFVSKVAKRLLFLNQQTSNPAATALEPWLDESDCWCASVPEEGQDRIRLGVEVNQLIYPTEVVIEHFPAAGSMSPESAPRDVELWADFGHLSFDDRKRLQLHELLATDSASPYYKTAWARIGQASYTSSKHAPHIQTFGLEVNQFSHDYPAQKFILRVLSNYGHPYTCLYRIRLHGESVQAKSGAKYTDGWHEDGQ